MSAREPRRTTGYKVMARYVTANFSDRKSRFQWSPTRA